VLPSPTRILGALWDYRDDAVRHALPTLLETVVGFLLAVVLAILAAVLMDRTPAIRRAVEPLLVTSQTIPIVALAPLFLLWFGFGLLPKVLIVVLVTFFPIVVSLLDGFRTASVDATDLLRSYGATDGQAFRKLRWPIALPAFFTGLRISVVYAVIGAVFGEYVGAREGLGIWMQLSQNSFRTDLVFAAIVVTSAISLVLYWAVGLIRRVAIPWAPGVRREPDLESLPF
jgi:ABC-type nitrate/sulfonate/bicarbonate transport system permease component